jgi:carbon-monoxide dehydrogenase medium subunit
MQPFSYARPTSLAEAIALLDERGPDARVLAGGTDLIIRLRDGSATPSLVVDVKRVAELAPGIRAEGDTLVIGATTVMTEIAAHPVIRRDLAALAESAAVVGSVQIRNRATLGGNLCNASPAADTAPALLVHGAVARVAGPGGERRIPLDELFVRSGVTTLARGELLTAVEIPPPPAGRIASAHQRRTRRRGHDLASVTVACGVDAAGTTRVAFGSVGPRPLLRVDAAGVLADRGASPEAKAAAFEAIFADASPSARSMRAGPEYRLAMLRVLGRRALATALERLGEGGPA